MQFGKRGTSWIDSTDKLVKEIDELLDAADTADSIIREFDDTESSITSVSQIGRRRGEVGRMPLHGTRAQQLRAGGRYGDASSVLSSEIETTSFFDTEDNESMASSRFTTSTEATSVSRQHASRVRKQKRLKHRKVKIKQRKT